MPDAELQAVLREAAVEYAGRGLPVFPCRGKEPLTEHGFHDASTDIETVLAWWKRWPTANVAVRTGVQSGLVVLDVDAGGGAGSLRRLEVERGKLPATAEALTGGGGRHYLFRHPGQEVRNSAGKLGTGIDVRGDGGYIVAPPSVHESGRVYRWIRPLEKGIAECPPWLLEDAEKRRNGPAPKLDEIIPEGKRREAMLSVAGKLKHSGLTGTEILPTLRELNRRCRPPLDERELESVALKSTIAPDPDAAIRTVAVAEPRALADVVGTFRKWLYLPDPGALYIALATVAANRLSGDPVWLLLVGASSCGKTEILFSLGGLEEIVPAATLTEASLLSGVPRKDVAAGASGGLLKKIGDYGVLTLKDFGSVLSMHRDARAAVLAALRECYDGSWDRPVGADGGRVLHWQGKLGLVAGVTTVVDRHHAVIDSLGSRFAFYRIEIDERKKQAGRALEHRRRGRGMRQELRDAVAGFFAGLELPEDDAALSGADEARLVDLADFVTVARSPVERDAYASREIELIPDAEAPARFAIMLAALLEGLLLIGIGAPAAWGLVTKVAFDSMPAQRRRIIEHLSARAETTTKEAATALGLPTTTARRTLEDLAAHGLVHREEGGKPGAPDIWRLAPELAVPEMSDTPIRHPTPLTTTFRERA
jgi:DNA-binding transcriptional ArsR family regulator